MLADLDPVLALDGTPCPRCGGILVFFPAPPLDLRGNDISFGGARCRSCETEIPVAQRPNVYANKDGSLYFNWAGLSWSLDARTSEAAIAESVARYGVLPAQVFTDPEVQL